MNPKASLAASDISRPIIALRAVALSSRIFFGDRVDRIPNRLEGILGEAFHMGISAQQVRKLLDGRIDDMNRTGEE